MTGFSLSLFSADADVRVNYTITLSPIRHDGQVLLLLDSTKHVVNEDIINFKNSLKIDMLRKITFDISIFGVGKAFKKEVQDIRTTVPAKVEIDGDASSCCISALTFTACDE